jgi:tetratricopeptide (TPR) repeat protein
VPDVLLGCGVGYMAIFAALLLAGPEIRAVVPLGLLPIVSVFFGTPHYGATLLRVYEQPSERRAYVVFTVYLTALVWALYLAGLYHAAIGSFLLTLYLTWSPWHYTGQNYGVALLFLRRRGVEVTPELKRWLWLSYVLSYFLTFLAIHGALGGADYAPADYAGSIYQYVRIGIPSPWWQAGFAVLGAAYLVATVAAGRMLLRRARPRDLVPTALVTATQFLWFSLPPFARELGLLRGVDPFEPSLAAFVFVWVAAGHAAQYLWVTTYYAGARARSERWRYYAKCVFAGSAIWSLPAILYVAWRGAVGVPWGGLASGEDAGVLLAAMVNIHHFMLDGAIWKLRDGRVARALIRREAAGVLPAALGVPRRRWLAPVLLGAGAVWTFTTVGSLVERERAFSSALDRGDLAAAESSLQRLAWMRRDAVRDYHRVAEAAHEAGDTARALALLDRAIARHARPASWRAKGQLLEGQHDVAAAAAAYEEGLRAAPDDAELQFRLGRARLALGQPEEALRLLEQARARTPADKRIEFALERARRAPPASPASQAPLPPSARADLR